MPSAASKAPPLLATNASLCLAPLRPNIPLNVKAREGSKQTATSQHASPNAQSPPTPPARPQPPPAPWRLTLLTLPCLNYWSLPPRRPSRRPLLVS